MGWIDALCATYPAVEELETLVSSTPKALLKAARELDAVYSDEIRVDIGYEIACPTIALLMAELDT
jgi:hypothetical protein